MPVFEYQGIDGKGKSTEGIVDAENERAARLKLRRNGIFTTKIHLEGKGKGFSLGNSFSFMQGVKTAELAQMTRQLSTLLGANIPLVDALSALQDQITNPTLKKSISQIKEKVTEGARLADAMKGFPKIYNDLYLHMVRAGESSGALEKVMDRLSDFTEYQAKLKSKVTGAMVYPIVMSCVGTVLLLYLLVAVVPNIVSVFEDAKKTLPLPTQMVMWMSEFAQNYWYLIILGIAGIAFLIRRYVQSPQGRIKFDRFKLKMPLFGELFRKIAISRFSRTLATLLRSGVQLLPSLDIVKNVVDNKIIGQAIENTKSSVKEGESLVEPLRKSNQFPPLVIHMIGVGEKTGALEVMLEKAADSYDDEVETTVSSLTTLLEPLMLLVMGAIVAFIVVAIMLPIMDMASL